MSLASKFALSPHPGQWDPALLSQRPEADDYLHNPDPRRDRLTDSAGSILTRRGLVNIGCLAVLASALVCLLCVPIAPLWWIHVKARFLIVPCIRSSRNCSSPNVRRWGHITLEEQMPVVKSPRCPVTLHSLIGTHQKRPIPIHRSKTGVSGILCSVTSSTRMGGPFILAMTRTGKPSICTTGARSSASCRAQVELVGFVLGKRTTWNGTRQTKSQPQTGY